jgi:hemophore-related protein
VTRALIAAALLAASIVTMPTAQAETGCTAASLSAALGVVGNQTAVYLAAHPDADAAISSAGASPNPEDGIRNYFIAHQDQWRDLQGIAQPLRTLKQNCQVDVGPGQVAQLFAAMAS